MDVEKLPKPVAWATYESMFRLESGGNHRGYVPMHAKPSAHSKVGLYTEEQMKQELDKCLNNQIKSTHLEHLLRDALQTIQAALGQVDDCTIKHVDLAEDVHTLARQLKLTVFKSHADVCGGVVYKDRVKQGVSPSAEVSEI